MKGSSPLVKYKTSIVRLDIPIGTAGGKLVQSGYCPNLAGGRRIISRSETIQVPTLILHGMNDQVCLYPLAIAQKNSIMIELGIRRCLKGLTPMSSG